MILEGNFVKEPGEMQRQIFGGIRKVRQIEGCTGGKCRESVWTLGTRRGIGR